MYEAQLNYGMISEKSKETGIPFANILGGAILEEAVRRISLSDYQETLLLKNKSVLGEAQYREKLKLNLEYDYMVAPEEEGKEDAVLLNQVSAGLLEQAFGGVADYGIVFYPKCMLSRRFLQLQLQAGLAGMKVPVSVRISLKRGARHTPVMESLYCMMFPEIIIFYYRYPAETLLADSFMEIVQKLELLRDIGVYYEVYGLLGCAGVDARKVKEQIEASCVAAKLEKEWKRMEMIAGYGRYAYMKKRWNVFLRSVGKKEPSWEAVIERFLGFYEPIWQSILENAVFFGDWMPEINRFL